MTTLRIACIPAHNEESSITRVIGLAKNHVDRVVVCDDGSDDRTADRAKDAGAVVISHGRHKGYGAAIISLFDYARREKAEALATLDGDGQHDPGQIPLLLHAIRQHNVDVVIGSRFLSAGAGDVPGYRKRGIRIITSAANYGTDLKVSDSQSGFRAYSANAISSIHPTEEGMAVSTEILQKVSNKGLSLAEVPITVSYTDGTSQQHAVSHGASVLASTLKYASIKHPLQFYGIPGIVLLTVGAVLGGVFLDQYLNHQTVFYGSLLASGVTFLVGAILLVTSIILFTMANLIRDRY